MAEARDQIFAALRAASPPPSSLGPSPSHNARSRRPAEELPKNSVQIFSTRVSQAGGQFEFARKERGTTNINSSLVIPEATHVFSEYPSLPSRGVGAQVSIGSPESSSFRSESLGKLDALEVCVLQGIFGVVENGAVWHVPASPAIRAAALLAEHLVIVLDSGALVPTLHQAYERIGLLEAPFGWFLCGPSKTADIEQALVLGAHGPKTMRLVLQDGSGVGSDSASTESERTDKD